MNINLINFYNELEGLKKTIRYNGAPNAFLESTADHSWRLAFICLDIIDKFNIDINVIKVLKLSLIHDLGEYNQNMDITIADIKNGKFSKEDKKYIEKNAIVNLTKQYNRNDIYDFWIEYENETTNEALFVKLIDRIESMLHILDKLKKGNIIDNLSDDVVYADKYINNFPCIKPFLKDIKEQYKIEFIKIGLEWKNEYNLD